jgi:fluoroquinolone transport system ATP-binding protein
MIIVENISYHYPKSENDTINNMNFSIEKGEIYGFLGPSGAGKSTTQNILIKLLSGFDGNISILNKDLKIWGPSFYNHVGVGFELPNHYAKLTGLENLKFFSSFYDKRCLDPFELLELIGLKDAANQKTEDYSKGMKMRLNFIRALLHNPELYFFDEPTSGLDPVNARHIKNIILDLKSKGKTIFITTHNMHDADELCDRVAFITAGSIRSEGAPKDLKLKYGQPLLKMEYQNEGLKSQTFGLDGLATNEEFQSILSNHKVISMHSAEASLEEVFVEVTGERLNHSIT